MDVGITEDGFGTDGLQVHPVEVDLQCVGDNGHAGKGDTGSTINGRRKNDFRWSCPDDGSPRRYKYPTLGAGHVAFVRAQADPLACKLDNDMVLLWNEVTIDEDSAACGNPPSEESIEDAYQRLFAAAVRHRADLQATLKDAGLERVNDFFPDTGHERVSKLFTNGGPQTVNAFFIDGGLERANEFADSDSACGALDDAREDVDGQICKVNVHDDDDVDDDVFDDSGVRGSWEFLSDDVDIAEPDTDVLAREFDLDLCNGYVRSPTAELIQPYAGELFGDLCHGENTSGREVYEVGEKRKENFSLQQEHSHTDLSHSSANSASTTTTTIIDHHNENNYSNFHGVERTSFSNKSKAEHINNAAYSTKEMTSQLANTSSSRFDSGLYDTSCSSDSESDHEAGEADQDSGCTPRPGPPSTQAVDTPRSNFLAGSIGDTRRMYHGDTTPYSSQDGQIRYTAGKTGSQTGEISRDIMTGNNLDTIGSQTGEASDVAIVGNGDELRQSFRHSRDTMEHLNDSYPREDAMYQQHHDLSGQRAALHSVEPTSTWVESPPANMDKFRPQSDESSSTTFMSSSPIPARSRRFYAERSPNSSSPHVLDPPDKAADFQTSVTVPDPGSPHTDWSGMSILPVVASPHHHDLPVIDAPGSHNPALIRCSTPECGKTVTLDIARHLYKNCHNCRTGYYCSRKCRRRDWKRHKHDDCHGSRVSSACKRVIQFCGLDPDVKASLSRLARRGYLSFGRGCVMLGFPDLRATEEFLCRGFKSSRRGCDGLELLPVFVTLQELRDSKMYGGAAVLQRLMTLCETYNPDLKFLLNVGIGVRWNREQHTASHHTLRVNGQEGSFEQTVSCNSRSILNVSSGINSTFRSSLSRSSVSSPKGSSPSFYSTTLDSGYGDLHRSVQSKHPHRPRSNNSSARSRSASVNSEDIGYGSLGDIRDSLAHSPLSPSHSYTDGAVFHGMQPPQSPPYPYPSPLSPPASGDTVVFYCDAEPRLKCPILQRCACLRLFNPTFDLPPLSHHSYPHTTDKLHDTKAPSPSLSVTHMSKYNLKGWRRRCGPTLILTDVPGSWYEAQEELRLRGLNPNTAFTADLDSDRKVIERKARELCFANIQRRLRQRGVSLDHQFPEVYDELVDYVAGDLDHFPSRIIFPIDEHGTGRMFTCVLMPEAEPDLRWTQSAKLLDNLDISRARVWPSPDKPSWSSYTHSTQEKSSSSQPGHERLQSAEIKISPDDLMSQPHKSEVREASFQTTHDSEEERDGQEKIMKDASDPQIRIQVCPRCLSRSSVVDRSTQTGGPVNTTKVKVTVPDLIKHCPTSAVMRRKFNTNFPIFSFDPEILETLTAWANSSTDRTDQRQTMAPMLLGHATCRSLLQRYQNQTTVSGSLKSRQCPVVSHLNSMVSSGNEQHHVSRQQTIGSREPKENEEKQTISADCILIPAPPSKDSSCKFNQSYHLPKPPENSGGFISTTSASGGHTLPSQDQVDSILNDWKTDYKSPGQVNPPHATTKENAVPWSCRFCSDRHPHNHPYQDPQSIRGQHPHRSNPSKRTSCPSSSLRSPLSNSNHKYHHHHHQHHPPPLSHQSRRRQQEVKVAENLQSDW